MRRILLLCFVVVFVSSGCSIFKNSSERRIAEQEETVDVIRDIGTAIEAYKLSKGSYPVSSDGHLEKIEDLLVPEFLEDFDDDDGWGTEIEYYCQNPEGPYYLISLGSDKERDVGLYKTDRYPSGFGFNVISNLKEDIIFSNGMFVRYPPGARVTAQEPRVVQ